MVVAESERTEVHSGPSLYDESGEWLTCPSCQRRHPTWRFRQLQRNPAYVRQTVPVMKCPVCAHVFAPLFHPDHRAR